MPAMEAEEEARALVARVSAALVEGGGDLAQALAALEGRLQQEDGPVRTPSPTLRTLR